MSDTYGEAEELEALRQWWLKNWKALVAGVVIGLVAIGGWQGWTRHQAAQRVNAASMYADFQQAMAGNKNGDVHAIAAALAAKYASTPYASDAALKLAQADVSHLRFDDAAKRLQWVVQHGNDAGTRAVAQLRLAAVLWQQGKNDAALKLLARPSAGFAGLYAALRGDIDSAAGQRDAARVAYELALKDLPAGAADRVSIQDKLDDLAGLASTTAKAAKPATAATAAGAVQSASAATTEHAK
ncbi:MAG TPA: tetratricopeptide repeat protein [Nevskiaceae bacterium]|nr:tetratricopeptide repeat protein [Nevskiaceae bacterium]